MKTENTLRTARNSLLCIFTALAASFLVACGSDGGGGFGAGGGGGGGGGDAGNGTFHAKDWVVGLDYTYRDNGETGKTGVKGAFSFEKGQTVAFSIGQVTLGNFVSNADEDFVTPTRIEDGDLDAVDVERLLIALDSSSGDSGTIVLDENSAADAVAVTTALTMTGTIALSDGVTVARSIPARDVAQGFLENTNNCAFSGAFEGTWTQGAVTGETALVLLAFNSEILPPITDPIPDDATIPGDDVVNAGISELSGQGSGRTHGGEALYIDLWKGGESSQTTPVDGFGASSGRLAIDLNGFPLVLTISTTWAAVPTITLTVESYDRITYTSAQETGEYLRVANGEVRDADYRIAGFYSDGDNDKGEAEIGIYAFSANKGGGSVRPYVGWFSSPLAGPNVNSVYSNIGEGGLSSLLTYTGTPESDGGMTFTEDDGSSFTVIDFRNKARGYGVFSYSDTSDGEIEDLAGGWCAL